MKQFDVIILNYISQACVNYKFSKFDCKENEVYAI